MKEQINISNYEAYLLDDLEGNLSTLQREELESFLILHPELKTELEEMRGVEEFYLPTNEATFDEKEALKKTDIQVGEVSASTFGDRSIADIEGIATTKEKEELKSFIQKNDWAEKEYKLYTKTKVSPDTAIVYPEKNALYRKTKVVAFYQNQTFWKGVAAAAVLLIGLFTVFDYTDERVYELRKNDFSALVDLNQNESVWEVLRIAEHNTKIKRQVEEELKLSSSLKPNYDKLVHSSTKGEAVKVEVSKRKLEQPLQVQAKPMIALIGSNVEITGLQLYSVEELNAIETKLLVNYSDESPKTKFSKGLSVFKELIALGKKELSEKASDVQLIEKKYDKDGALEYWAFRVGSISVTHQVK